MEDGRDHSWGNTECPDGRRIPLYPGVSRHTSASLDPHRIRPAFVSSDQGRAAKRFVIVTRRASQLTNLVSLRGKTLNVLSAANANLGLRWLRVVLAEYGLGALGNFFGDHQSFAKPTSVVLPVFFGKRDACLVDGTGLELMTELNPQVGTTLQIIATSEPLVNAVICLSEAKWSSARFKEDVVFALGDLHADPAGQQILTLFKTGQLLPFDATHLETVRVLQEKFRRLEAATVP